ncbi:MAG: DUF2141 domain-containing protein [Phaeodactylibacter sp.]|nr:DUF2141 domain-containing protein [Phaeodactylibacter sp.]
MTAIIWMSLMLSPATVSGGKTDTGSLALNIQNLETAGGEVHIALFGSEADFMETEKRVVGLVVPIKSREPLQVTLGNFPFGTYAIAVFHDLNNNGKLDKNALGIPTEPYAFSNNPRAKWRSPTFREACFELRQAELRLDVVLKEWKDF